MIMANKNHNSAFSQTPHQQGAVLIVSLVMLTILTILAIGTTSDVGLQANMTKNSQISLRAFNASMGQLNTMSNDLRKNDAYQTVLGNLLLTKTSIPGIVTATASNPFTITTNIYQVESFEDDSVGGSNIHGGTIKSSMEPAVYKFEINSVSALPNSGIGSDQTYKVIYEKPPSSG
jgi:Tfp pilus assembly protein PilX